MSDDNLDIDTLNKYLSWYEKEINGEKFLIMEGKDYVDVIPKENALVSFNEKNCFRIHYKGVIDYYLSNDFREVERYDFVNEEELIATAVEEESHHYYFDDSAIPFELDDAEDTLVKLYEFIGEKYMAPYLSKQWDSYKACNREYIEENGEFCFMNIDKTREQYGIINKTKKENKMIKVKKCDGLGVAYNEYTPVYSIEFNGVEYIIVESANADTVGIIHEKDVKRTCDRLYYLLYEDRFNADTYWINFLHWGSGGLADDYNDRAKEYKYDVCSCISDEVDNLIDNMRQLKWFKTEEEYYNFRELAEFLVDRYIRPFIEYGFFDGVQQKGDSEDKLKYVPLDTHARGIRLDCQYTATRAYDEESENEIMACSEYDKQVQGFHDYGYISIWNDKFFLTICQLNVELFPVDLPFEDMKSEMPCFLDGSDESNLLKHIKQMQEEYLNK